MLLYKLPSSLVSVGTTRPYCREVRFQPEARGTIVGESVLLLTRREVGETSLPRTTSTGPSDEKSEALGIPTGTGVVWTETGGVVGRVGGKGVIETRCRGTRG